MLAAHDFQTAFKEQFPRVWVSCYTLGSPRVGNQAFADTFNNSGDLRASMALAVSATLRGDSRLLAARWGQQALMSLRCSPAARNTLLVSHRLQVLRAGASSMIRTLWLGVASCGGCSRGLESASS